MAAISPFASASANGKSAEATIHSAVGEVRRPVDKIAVEGAEVDLEDEEAAPVVEGDVAAQIKQVFENLKAVVTAAGATFDNVVKVNVYLTDIANSGLVNKIMAEYFREPYPARGAVGVASLAAGAQVEVECIVAF